MMPGWSRRLSLADPAATAAFGRNLAACLRPGDVVALRGDLGAGKTTLARAIIQSLIGNADPVPSPTFTLAQHYATPHGVVWHFDFYRLKHPDEIFELGWDDALADGIVLVEWPERAGDAMPRRSLSCALTETDEGGRVAILSGTNVWSERLAAL